MAQQALVKAFSMADVMYDARIAMFQHFSTALPNATDRNYFQNKINEIFSEKRSHEDALMRMLDMLHEAMRAACNAN
jgi:hypothetical protein